MHSFLIIAGNRKQLEEYSHALCKDRNIPPLDMSIPRFEEPIGIEEIRMIKKNLFFKPLQGNQKAVILHTDVGITTEAQNALLKVLEEPPLSSIIILTAANKESLLPTILSRCFITELNREEKILSQRDIDETELMATVILHGTLDEKLVLAETFSKNKNMQKEYLETLAVITRAKILEQIEKSNADSTLLTSLIKGLQKTYSVVLSTNANNRLALENLFLFLGS